MGVVSIIYIHNTFTRNPNVLQEKINATCSEDASKIDSKIERKQLPKGKFKCGINHLHRKNG